MCVGAHTGKRQSVFPFPVQNFRHVYPVFIDIAFVFDEFLLKMTLKRGAFHGERQLLDRVQNQMKPVQTI